MVILINQSYVRSVICEKFSAIKLLGDPSSSTPTVKRTVGSKVPYKRPVASFIIPNISMLNDVLIG